jgi:hypothetical protein
MSTLTRPAAVRPAIYLLILVAALTAAYVFKLRTGGIFACPGAGYTSSNYLGYCNAPTFGEYDHGALWFGLEPEASSAAARADVLFIGNSRMEFGFSAAATDRWFAAQGARHYLLGFTFLENATFAAPLLERIKPRALVYVINVDGFFTTEKTLPGAELTSGADVRQRFSEKRAWQRVHRPLCTRLPRLCGNRVAFFRERDNGHWQMEGFAPGGPLAMADEPPTDQTQWDQDAALARAFIAKLPVAPGCVLLTVVPSPTTRRAEAQAIATAVGLPLLSPAVPGLQTVDDTHMSRASAERWSAAFLELAGPRIRQCLGNSRAGAP